MGKGRLEAFSDGVLAIIITIMVLEMKAPHSGEPTLESLQPIWPVFLSYVLSFVYIGIYWNNHHHMMHTIQHVNGAVLWANIHLLFWLSLVPFTTAWMGENHFALWPVVIYGVVLCMAGVAYYILSRALIALHGKQSTLALAVGRDRKGILSVVLYIVGMGFAFLKPAIGLGFYILVATIWLIPDRRIEKRMQSPMH